MSRGDCGACGRTVRAEARESGTCDGCGLNLEAVWAWQRADVDAPHCGEPYGELLWPNPQAVLMPGPCVLLPGHEGRHWNVYVRVVEPLTAEVTERLNAAITERDLAA